MQEATIRRGGRRRTEAILGGAAGAVIVLVALTSTAGAATTTSNPPIGASGSVASLSASSMEVQNPINGQTTVNWTATTTFSKAVSKKVGTLVVGDCITVTGTVSKKSKTTIAARSISLTTASSNGSCAGPGTGGPATRIFGGGPGGGGGFPGGSRRVFSGGASAGGNFRTQLTNLSVANGKITAVKGSKLTVSGTTLSLGSLRQPSNSSKSGAKNKKPATPKTQKLTITTASSTPVDTTQSVSASALAVGDCVSAFGPAASNGSVTATTVRIMSTGGGNCGGFPGGAGFPGGGSGGNVITGG